MSRGLRWRGSYWHRGSEDQRRRNAQQVRVIDYTLKDSAVPVQNSYRLVTNILDPEAAPAPAPALELAALYHERWKARDATGDARAQGDRARRTEPAPDRGQVTARWPR